MSELPSSWCECTIADLFSEIKNGTTQKQNKDAIGIPVTRIETIQKGRFDLNRIQHIDGVDEAFINANKYEVGDLAFSHINSYEHVGKTAIYKGEPKTLIHGMNLLRLRPFRDFIDPDFLYYQLNSRIVREEVRKRVGHAVNQVSINQSNLRVVPLSLAPLNEQKRIVAKLDELLPKVEACKERLEKIPTILKRFRQSVLAAAVSGKLTEEWRKEKYGTHEIEDELPTSWKVVPLRDVVTNFNYGSSAKSERSGKVPVLRMGNIQNGEIDWTNLVYSNNEQEIKKYLLAPNTVLFNRTNSPELVGKTAIYRGEREAIFAGYLIRLVAGEELNPEYLSICLNSSIARSWCREVKTDGVSQSNINAQKVAAFEIFLPPIEEQAEIALKVKTYLTKLDTIANSVNQATKFTQRSADAILSKAFSGELAHQDSNDEPASVLLERIKAEAPTKSEKKSKKSKSIKKGSVTAHSSELTRISENMGQ